jgi:uncharacterized protein YdeI (BOF family)
MKKTATVTGECVLAPNPCTTFPCLPGMVYAVLSDGKYYYMTVDQSLLWAEGEQMSWKGCTLKVGDRVNVVGEMDEKLDINGKHFYQIEVKKLKRV